MNDTELGATVLGYAAGQKVFQRFTLKKLLGRGGMGVVWLAVDDKLEREVALKFLPEVMKSDRPAMEELKRETRRALDLTHANIVRFYDFVENETNAAISMEYISGDTLSNRRLAQPGQVFEPPALRRWVRQLCEALAYAHERGAVVHRDLKPANLLVDGHGDIKVTDFGIARSISDSVSRVSAQASTSGTPAYMSPQQMLGERQHPTDDIYSFGATLYELLTGKSPFYSGNILVQVQTKVPPSIAERRRELGVTGGPIAPEWEEAIAACLAKDVKARPQTVRALAQRLGVPMATPTASPFIEGKADVTPGGGSAPARRRWWPVAVVALLALAGAGYYLGVVRPERRAAVERQRLAEIARQEEAQKLLLARQQDEAKKTEEARKAREATEARFAGETFKKRVRNGELSLAELKAIAQEQSPRGRLVRERLEELRNETGPAELPAPAQILQLIDKLPDNAPRAVFEDTEKQVRAYLANAPERQKPEVTRTWLRRQTAWKEYEAAHTPGSLVVTTQPAGALVTLLPRRERKPSPALFTDVAPGAVTLHVEREGFEPRDVMLTVKAGAETKPEVVRLVPLIGAASITSNPPGVKFTLEVGGRTLEGVTPRRIPALPQGRYRLTFQREGGEPVVRFLEVTKGGDTPLHVDFAPP
ncbi:MAG: protein kinase [Lacunisphaera sp.]|nr:protein kinase [Lacunisphaera sp.]